MEFINHQNWRYATKKFESNKKVSPGDIELLKEAIQLSVSSYGLQPYKVLIIEDQSLRKELREVSWNQSQITDASHLFVFCNEDQVDPQDIDGFIKLTANTRGLDKVQLSGYGDFMKAKLGEKSKKEQFNWSKNQTYIAMANLLAASAELGIDACPMEGFEAGKYNQILGLHQKGLNASVVVPVGYRSREDASQHMAKVRKPVEQLFEYS
ncbi:NAD(P)H-dependent oxidoreductase [Flagellimonas algicola]|uniref:NAD(P)H-dependent oxidoreductase n=1 Tax=Flagellimonas algicola TaxID=2583815 RepID=A0ABY2WIP0_9FLAO|nr:NAD(P)H-dependent oxidoreductase [Allomuricauda algicola]TMU54470.1 NAD(P)H-dependent oxidoreductase [Allomuricauda algicola]